ncbi:MAG: hypothetical protein WBF67_05250, partial [Olleya sp.]
SNLIDMRIWMQMLNGQLPQFKQLSDFLKTQDILNNGEVSNYARGLMINDYRGYKIASHSGFGFGGQSHLINVPQEKIGIIIMTNLQSINPGQLAYTILDMILMPKEKELVKSENTMSFNPQDLNQFTGDYKEINSDMTMHITIDNDTLKAKGSIGKIPVALLQNDKNEFVRYNSQSVKYNFTKTEKHDMTISFGGTPFYFKRAKIISETPKNLNDFEGNYYSEELDITYNFFIDQNMLKLSYYRNESIPLYPIQHNAFGNHDRTLYQFIESKNHEVTGMLLSCDGQVSEIEFIKKKP